jgi:hypothetical protein
MPSALCRAGADLTQPTSSIPLRFLRLPRTRALVQARIARASSLFFVLLQAFRHAAPPAHAVAVSTLIGERAVSLFLGFRWLAPAAARLTSS